MSDAAEFALGDQIEHIEEIAARKARFASLTAPTHPKLKEKMEELGFTQLFTHQAEAYNAFADGKDLVVVTGTNSGKTLCYHLPTLQACLSEPAARALYLFPTKALAQDQLKRLNQLLISPLRAGTYDGDTPQSQRSSIRKLAHVILSNPDMLHIGMLPMHENWTTFLRNLRVIVIDEMHTYRGVFGSHVGNLIRRLLRLCESHRNRPQVIACSATISNPVESFRKLTGREPELISEDGSPQGKRTFIFWNPPMLQDASRASANVTTAHIISDLTQRGLRSLAFCRSRVGTELVLRYACKDLPEQAAQMESYRGGYTPKERREIEANVAKGKIKSLVATNAMELGVDIGGLDAVVINGYPGSISSFWQQAGRAGRGAQDGIAILVAHDDPLEQYLIREPQVLLNKPVERVSLNPENPQILGRHLLCAAHERPLSAQELERFGPSALDLAESMDRAGELSYRAGAFYYPSFEPPAPGINIRGTNGQTIRLMVGGEELGTMEQWRALQYAHPGAIYLHRGLTFHVKSLDLETGYAVLSREDLPFYTIPVTQSSVELLTNIRTDESGIVDYSLAGIRVTDVMQAYKQKSVEGDRTMDIVDLSHCNFPPQTFETLAVRIDFPSRSPLESKGDDPFEYPGALHGVEHALIAVAPLVAGCDRNDLGSAWYSVAPDTLCPCIYIFDRTPGGVGLCEQLMETFGYWREAALNLLESCPCVEGCPACLLSSRCESSNEHLEKQAAITLLKLI